MPKPSRSSSRPVTDPDLLRATSEVDAVIKETPRLDPKGLAQAGEPTATGRGTVKSYERPAPLTPGEAAQFRKVLGTVRDELAASNDQDMALFISLPGDRSQEWVAPFRHLQEFGHICGLIDDALAVPGADQMDVFRTTAKGIRLRFICDLGDSKAALAALPQEATNDRKVLLRQQMVLQRVGDTLHSIVEEDDPAGLDHILALEAEFKPLTQKWHDLMDKAAALGCEVAKDPERRKVEGLCSQVDLARIDEFYRRMAHRESNAKQVVEALHFHIEFWENMVDILPSLRSCGSDFSCFAKRNGGASTLPRSRPRPGARPVPLTPT